MNYLYVILVYTAPLVATVFLLDLIWLKRIKFLLKDKVVTSGFMGLTESLKLAFTNEINTLPKFYGSDVYLYIYFNRKILYGVIQLYIVHISFNLIFSFLLT